jgi:hypothetical protein
MAINKHENMEPVEIQEQRDKDVINFMPEEVCELHMYITWACGVSEFVFQELKPTDMLNFVKGRRRIAMDIAFKELRSVPESCLGHPMFLRWLADHIGCQLEIPTKADTAEDMIHMIYYMENCGISPELDPATHDKLMVIYNIWEETCGDILIVLPELMSVACVDALASAIEDGEAVNAAEEMEARMSNLIDSSEDIAYAAENTANDACEIINTEAVKSVKAAKKASKKAAKKNKKHRAVVRAAAASSTGSSSSSDDGLGALGWCAVVAVGAAAVYGGYKLFSDDTLETTVDINLADAC